MAWKVASLREAGTHIMDRATYEAMAIGHGTGLFSALRESLRLDLIEARRFPSGTAIHVFRPREGNR